LYTDQVIENTKERLVKKMVPPTASQLAATTRLFSSAVFREMAKKGRSALFARLLGESGIVPPQSTLPTVADAFEAAFALLRTVGLRDEYIYRAALTQKMLMGRHSLNTACMLNEFRAGTSKADLVILNGTATAYEIKSERDSLDRLASQIKNYKKVFARTYVIASERHISKLREILPNDVGIMSLSRRYRISTEREAMDRSSEVCPITIFESLRSAEAQAILSDLKIPIPAVPNTRIHAAMRERFRELDAKDVQTSMVRVLKRTRDLAPLAELVDRLPKSLHAAALSIPVRRACHPRLVQAVETPLSSAVAWS
jgi:hypothetical protein